VGPRQFPHYLFTSPPSTLFLNSQLTKLSQSIFSVWNTVVNFSVKMYLFQLVFPIHHSIESATSLCFQAVHPPCLSICLSVCSSGQILSPQYLMNGLSNLSETYNEYSLAPTDDLVRFRRSKVKVTAGCRGGKGFHVNDGWKSIF